MGDIYYSWTDEELVDAGVQPMANKFDSEATLAC